MEAFEQCFGKLRSQTTPCGASVLAEDLTSPLAAKDAFAFRSIIGTCLYVNQRQARHLVHCEGAQQCNGEANSWCTSETEEVDGLLESHSRLLHGARSPGARTREMEKLGTHVDLGELHGRRLVFESSAQKINKLRHSSSLWMLCLREQ